MAMHQASCALKSSKPSAASHEQDKDAYETVHPPSGRTMSLLDSWSERTRSWWKRKTRQQRQRTTAQVCSSFTVVVIILLALVIGGAVIVYKKRQERLAVDKLLTTKTSICRAQYLDEPPECVYEDFDHYGSCSTDERHCKRIRWKIDLGMKLSRDEDSRSIGSTEFSDCGVKRWCRNGECVHKKTGWWHRDETPFPDSSAQEPWVERSILPGDVTNILPCLDRDERTLAAAKDFIQIIKDKYGEACNKDICSTGHARFGLRVKFYHCDLQPPDPTTGMRSRVCQGLPMKVFACDRCDQIDEQPISNCITDQDGRGCTAAFGTGVCLIGHCYKIENETSIK